MRKKSVPPNRTLAIVGRVTSFAGFGLSIWLAYEVMIAGKQPWVGLGVLLLGVAFANKFTGTELAAICHEIARAVQPRHLGSQANPELQFDEDDSDTR